MRRKRIEMSNYSFMSQFTVHTAPGDDWSSGDDGVPRCCGWGIKAFTFIPPAPSPTDLPITPSDSDQISPRFELRRRTENHKLRVVICTLTGMSMMQSSARQSLVTQCKNTVDIFWCLCLTKRKTSKEKRPI